MRSKEVDDAIDMLQNCIADYVIGDYCTGEYCPMENECKDKGCLFNDAIDKVVAYISELEEKSKKCEYYEEVADTLYKNSINKDKIRAKINNMFEIYHERYELDFEEVRQLISEIHGNVLKELEGE